MRILIDARAIDIWPHGVGRYARELAGHLPPLRTEWEWVVLRHGAPRQERQANAEHLWRPLPFGSYSEEQRGLAAVLDEVEPDVVHTLWYPVPEKSKALKILTIHDTIPCMGYPEFSGEHAFQQNFWHRRSVTLSDLIVTPSVSTLRGVVQHYQYPVSRIRVTQEGVSPAFLGSTAASQREVRERYQLPVVYAFCSAHQMTVSYKNVRVVEAAWRILHSSGYAAPQLVSTGSAKPGRDECWIRLPMLDDRDLASVLAGAVLMVYPSKAEGFGLPVVEAMACGVPVICSHSTSLPEVAGEAVMYFAPDDEHELAASVRGLMDSMPLSDALRRAGQIRARTFTWERTAKMTLKAYDEALALPRHDMGHDEFVPAPALEHSMDSLRERGKLLQSKGQWTDAKPLFEQMLTQARFTGEIDHQRSALFHLGECCVQLEAYPEAGAYLRECLTICPTHLAAPLLIERIGRLQGLLVEK